MMNYTGTVRPPHQLELAGGVDNLRKQADMTHPTDRARLIADYADRFNAKVEKTPSCWLWRGSINGSGYGTLRFGSRTDGSREAIGAHRFAYELAFGAISGRLVVHHKCFNRDCVNPDHLAAVTQSVNLSEHPPEFVPVKSRVTHCPQNHPYDEANTYLKALRNGKIGRCCRACGREANRKSYAKRMSIVRGV